MEGTEPLTNGWDFFTLLNFVMQVMVLLFFIAQGWCQALHAITQYFVSCNFFWMFCEGFYLHTIIVVAFVKGKKLLIGCFIIGWCEYHFTFHHEIFTDSPGVL